jgi:hypothetical protein
MSSKKEKVRGYISTTKEQIASLSATHTGKGVTFGITNLASFCRNIKGINYVAVSRVINEAKKDGLNDCEFDDWTFHWETIDDQRAICEINNIPLLPRLVRIHGLIPQNPKDATAEARPYIKAFWEFMS